MLLLLKWIVYIEETLCHNPHEYKFGEVMSILQSLYMYVAHPRQSGPGVSVGDSRNRGIV